MKTDDSCIYETATYVALKNLQQKIPFKKVNLNVVHHFSYN
jgi:hypothetical protein